jgi:hypothetical protein
MANHAELVAVRVAQHAKVGDTDHWTTIPR